MLIKKGALKNLTNHTGKTPMLKSPLHKTASPQARSFIKKRMQHRRSLPPPPPVPLHKTRKTSKNIPLYRTPPVMVATEERQNMI